MCREAGASAESHGTAVRLNVRFVHKFGSEHVCRMLTKDKALCHEQNLSSRYTDCVLHVMAGMLVARTGSYTGS